MRTRRSPEIARRGSAFERAFTFTDLLVVVVVLSLLLLLLIPAQADSRTKSQGVRCLDTLRQVMNAVLLYTRDNHDLFPPNPDDGTIVQGHNWCPGAAGRNQSGEFNPDLVARSLLMPYLRTNVSLFRCTADLRSGNYQGIDPNKQGMKVPAARSISINGAVGTICPQFDAGGGHAGRPTLPVNGPWLDGGHSHRRNGPYRTYGRLSDVVVPGPAKLWVISEEDPYSLNDGSFSVNLSVPEWIDFPSTQHGMSCVIGFADGHVEQHKWTDRRTLIVDGFVSRRVVFGSPDWTWLAERTSARAQ